MKRIIKLSLILLTLLMPVSAMSNPITTQQALQNVMNFMEKQGKSVSTSSLYLQTSSKSSNTSESYYVFNIGKNDGYVIAAGDDCAPTILGYANTGYINLDSIPNNMKEWLEEYSHQIQYMQENGQTSSKSHVLTSNRAAISPLLTTTWGQKDPYNQNCPDFFGYGKCVTGCVATAMAQVMYYHRAQSVTQTTAQIPAYTCRHRWISGSDTLQISVDAIPAGSPINWNNMLDSYGSSATTLQKQAVANLMKYCGASVQMDYANEWNGGSGAYSSDVPTALKTYFNYNNETVLKNRSSYSTNDAWESLIYNELSSLRPVYYSGRNNSAGHAFVCDGYDGNGYYHINWGWSSTSDGYFLLTALDPEEQGTGGSSSGYNQNQAALINAEPKSSSPSNPVLATSISLNKTSAVLNTGETFQLTATVLPSNATNKTVTWTSSNNSIASVNSNGLVIANATGSATITATTTDGSNLRATCVVTVYNNDHSLQNGEWAFLDDGIPAMVGQSTNDHLFVRMDYADDGVLKTYDNVVSFQAGTPQTVWFWLDDDEIYQNEKINTLTPIAYDNAGHLYNEITYSSFQCDVYLPQGFRIVSTENEDDDELKYAQGDRLPYGVFFEIVKRDNIVVDSITYTPYSIFCWNNSSCGSHFSAKNANGYKNNGALKKDDAPLFGLFIQNDNQEEIEGRLADMIIANQEFGVREAGIAGWAPNDYRFIYGTGGNNESQRFQLYNRVALYGSNGIDDIYAGGIYLNTTYKNLDVNETFQLTATVTPDNTTNKAVTWRSSNVNVATVDNNGNVRAISPGTATITATTADGSNLSASCYVTVNAGNVLATSISLNTNSLVLGINESSQLVATVYPSNTTNKTVNWYSSNTSVATVNSNGLVTAIAEGNATIIATTTDGTNLYASCMVSVNILATSISLSANSLTLDVNQTSQLTATIYPTNTTNKTVTWASSNTAVATVNTDGVITTISPGMATITATTTDGSNLSATCNVTVVRLVRSISLNENNLSLTVDQTAQLSATVYPSNATNKSVTWKSSNTNVATVSNNGLVTAKASGTATITATTTDGSNLSASCAVTVSSVPVTSISLNSVSVILDLSNTYTYQLVPTIIPSNATNKTVTWRSSNSAIATVSSTGLVTAKAPGSATITATTTDGTNLNASCQVTVIKRATGITLNNSSLTLTLPETARLVATITPNDATTQTLNWTSSNTSVATVDANGLITTKAIGTTTIKASTTDGSNLSASCLVTVKKQYINSITLNVETLVMHIGDTFQLIADVQPENASNTTLNWSTGNSSVASVDNNGLVTAVAGGTTYIIASATDGSNTYANCTIEVLPDYYLTLDTLSHIRGSLAQIQDLPVSLINKNSISGIQFDVKLPNGVDFNYVDDLPDIWLDENRATRTHSISANKLSNGNYRVLVTSSASKDLRGNDGVLVHMNMLLPQIHNTGNSYINISNIIASESDETRHTLNNTSTAVRFYYIVGDADANAVVDIADHASTASKILGYSPTPFYNDAANVDGNNSLDVVDLVGITNIALEIRPISIRQAPRRGNVENRLFCDKLHLYSGGEKEISIGIDCNFDFAGFQMDMKLPHGLTLMGATLGDEASKLGLDTQTMPDGTIRILGTSFSDASVNGVCPQLLTLRVRADRNYHSDSQIEFSDILFAERDLTAHCFDSSFIEYVEPSTIYELMDEVRIYVENGNIIVDTPIAGTVQLIAIDGRMIEYQAHVGHNVYPIDVSGVYIIHFLNKTIKVLL